MHSTGKWYEKDPNAFMKELKTVAKTADKHNLKVIYDNHQYHTSSWLDSTNVKGFPSKLFDKNKYRNGAGGAAPTWCSGEKKMVE